MPSIYIADVATTSFLGLHDFKVSKEVHQFRLYISYEIEVISAFSDLSNTCGKRFYAVVVMQNHQVFANPPHFLIQDQALAGIQTVSNKGRYHNVEALFRKGQSALNTSTTKPHSSVFMSASCHAQHSQGMIQCKGSQSNFRHHRCHRSTATTDIQDGRKVGDIALIHVPENLGIVFSLALEQTSIKWREPVKQFP